MTILGKNTAGSATGTSSGNKAVVSPVTASVTGKVLSGGVKIDIDSGSGSVAIVVYADSSGAPGALLAASNSMTITNTSSAFETATFSGANQITVTAGTNYWVGASWPDPGTPTFTYDRDGTANQRDEQSTNQPNPFGTPSLVSVGPIAAYVDVLPIAGVGAVSVGAFQAAITTSTGGTQAHAGVARISTAAIAALTTPKPGTAILQNVATGIRFLLEIAWGADLTNLTGSTWTWTDVTSDVEIGDGRPIQITMGTQDEINQTQASNFTVTLDNSEGAYSLGPQNTINYPNVVRGVPVRLRMSTDGGTTWILHYQGNAIGFTPKWDTTGKYAVVQLVASGPLRQLNQGSLPAVSAYTDWTLANQDAHLVGYWPLEDGIYSTTARAGITSNSPAAIIGDAGPLTIGASNTSGDLFACTGAMAAGGNFGGTIPTYTNSGVQQMMWLFAETAELVGTGAGNPVISFMYPATGTVKVWDSYMSSGGQWGFEGWSAVSGSGTGTGTRLFNTTPVSFDLINGSWLLSVTLTTSGANVIILMESLTPGGVVVNQYTQTATGVSSGVISKISVLSPAAEPQNSVGCSTGQMTLRNSSTGLFTYSTALAAYAGESLTTRLTRVANGNNIPITIYTATNSETSTNPADTMGPQFVDTITNLLREAEATGIGRIYDGLNIGLTYVPRVLRESQSSFMSVDVTQGAVVMPFAPIFDDQGIVNQVTVTRRNGSSFTYTDTTSADQIGIYNSSVQINQVDDTALNATAQWLVHTGTPDGYRYPTFSFELEKQPSLIANWLGCFPSCRIDVTNVSTARSQHPTGTLRNVLEGWTETIDQFRWHVDANCTSYEPWRVTRLAAATGGTSDVYGRYESDGSTITTNAAFGATSISVTTPSGPLWTQSSVTPDDFPLTISVNGIPVNVTAISGGTSPQTFTVSPLTHAVAAGDAVTIYQNTVLGM